MQWLTYSTDCPACGAPISLLVDEANIGSDYVEDCEVCCRPLIVTPYLEATGELGVSVVAEGS